MDLPVGFKRPEIKCPVVQSRRVRHGLTRVSSKKIPKPDYQMMIGYNPEFTLPQLERFWILSALEKCKGNITHAAKLLGVGKMTIYRRLDEYNEEK